MLPHTLSDWDYIFDHVWGKVSSGDHPFVSVVLIDGTLSESCFVGLPAMLTGL
jgi:hypothetical protein